MNGYVLAGWIATFGSLSAYAARVTLRARAVRRALIELMASTSQ